MKLLFTIYKDHKGFLKQIILLAKNELIKTYKGSVIGPFWAVIKPLFTLFVYWFAFAVGIRGGANRSEMGVPYFVFLMVGFVPWFFINDAILFGAKSIRANRQFVTKVSFPVSTIMTYVTLSKLFVHFLLTALMYLYLVCVGIMPMLINLQFFYYCPLMFIFFVVLSWSTAPMCAFSRDFENMIVSIMSGIFWLSGIVYNSYTLDIDWLNKVMYFNPINYFVNGYRKTFITGEMFYSDATENIIFFSEFVLIIILGIFNYSRLRKRLPDVL